MKALLALSFTLHAVACVGSPNSPLTATNEPCIEARMVDGCDGHQTPVPFWVDRIHPPQTVGAIALLCIEGPAHEVAIGDYLIEVSDFLAGEHKHQAFVALSETQPLAAGVLPQGVWATCSGTGDVVKSGTHVLPTDRSVEGAETLAKLVVALRDLDRERSELCNRAAAPPHPEDRPGFLTLASEVEGLIDRTARNVRPDLIDDNNHAAAMAR